ncbi:MAG: MBL fold metallo-hydrolase [Chloroflexota bacterium]|nr:MBL fold metallo-hydrolase [Chloroflexota bacterium]
MFVCSLGSGSSGNATVIRSAANRTILVDCGVPYPQLRKNLARLGIRPNEIDTVILSHEHSDHTQSVRPLHAAYRLPVVASPEFISEATWLGDVVTDAFNPRSSWTVGDITVTPCRVSHDAAATYGFIVEADGCTVALFTDLGGASESIRTAVGASDLVVIEANYDAAMLDAGSYPWFLKTRIKGRGGHLSNADCGALLAQGFTDDRPRDIWLAHLSANNNTPEMAVETVTGILHAAGLHRASVTALPRHAVGPIWQCVRHQQLTLFDGAMSNEQ